MIWVLVVFIALILIWGWSLGAIAAQSDRRIEQASRDRDRTGL